MKLLMLKAVKQSSLPTSMSSRNAVDFPVCSDEVKQPEPGSLVRVHRPRHFSAPRQTKASHNLSHDEVSNWSCGCVGVS